MLLANGPALLAKRILELIQKYDGLDIVKLRNAAEFVMSEKDYNTAITTLLDQNLIEVVDLEYKVVVGRGNQ